MIDPANPLKGPLFIEPHGLARQGREGLSAFVPLGQRQNLVDRLLIEFPGQPRGCFSRSGGRLSQGHRLLEGEIGRKGFEQLFCLLRIDGRPCLDFRERLANAEKRRLYSVQEELALRRVVLFEGLCNRFYDFNPQRGGRNLLCRGEDRLQ